MPQFLPLIATKYNKAKVTLAAVVAPPYDVISPDEQEDLYGRDPHNVVRLELNHDPDPYTSAREHFDAWIDEGVLLRDNAPAFYVYYQTFTAPNGSVHTREGVVGRMHVTPYAARQVLPHERTLAGPKLDRLNLMRAVKANLSPIFCLIDEPTRYFDQVLERATVNPAFADIDEILPSGETVRHVLWRLDDPQSVKQIAKIVESQPVIIADGHHRYETSVNYAEEHPEVKGSDHMLVFLSNIRAAGTVILPTHRALHGIEDFNAFSLLEALKAHFALEIFTDRETALEALEQDRNALTVIEFEDDPARVLVKHRHDSRVPELEVAALRVQEEIFKPFLGLTQDQIDQKTHILYPHSIEEYESMRASRKINAAFFLKPVTPDDMLAVVHAGDFMPQKSTFFYPKLLSGLLFHEFEQQI